MQKKSAPKEMMMRKIPTEARVFHFILEKIRPHGILMGTPLELECCMQRFIFEEVYKQNHYVGINSATFTLFTEPSSFVGFYGWYEHVCGMCVSVSLGIIFRLQQTLLSLFI